LSLSAAQNCAQNSGANRRDNISSLITDAFSAWDGIAPSFAQHFQ
jgi:hypothetical protein